MVEYFDIQSLCRLLPSIHSKMNCFWCEEKADHRMNLPVVNREVLLCKKHYRLFGPGIRDIEGSGPTVQNY